MSWAPIDDANYIATGVGPAANVRFASLSGNGKADYLYIRDGGAVDLCECLSEVNSSSHPYLRLLDRNGGQQGNGWSWGGKQQIASGAPGAQPDNVFFADINNDGRADYLVVGSKGELTAYLNVGSAYDITWVPQNQIATGLNTGNISISDITGDGRADYIIWDQLGGMTGYLNVRGPQDGIPIWIDQGPDKSLALGVKQRSFEAAS